MLNEECGRMKYDNLFNQNFPTADVFMVSLRAGQGILERGSILALGDTAKEFVILGETSGDGGALSANCILAETTDTGTESGEPIQAPAYRTGHFNGNILSFKEGYTFTLQDRESLRRGGILLDDAILDRGE